MDENYSYIDAGFSPFLIRSIDDSGQTNLGQVEAIQVNRELNYDQSPTTGQLGAITRIGNIVLDGVKGRITILDDNQNEVVWIGDIDA